MKRKPLLVFGAKCAMLAVSTALAWYIGETMLRRHLKASYDRSHPRA